MRCLVSGCESECVLRMALRSWITWWEGQVCAVSWWLEVFSFGRPMAQRVVDDHTCVARCPARTDISKRAHRGVVESSGSSRTAHAQSQQSLSLIERIAVRLGFSGGSVRDIYSKKDLGRGCGKRSGRLLRSTRRAGHRRAQKPIDRILEYWIARMRNYVEEVGS